MAKSKIFLSEGDDPEMLAAFEEARATFRYFWRELAWERRRIIPGLDLAAIKAPFSDEGKKTTKKKAAPGAPKVEQMWVQDVGFDGERVTGTLLNEPHHLTSIAAGDAVELPLAELSDWMYVVGGEVQGAYTVNLLRARMGKKERAEHDAAWGLEFGDPAKIRLVPKSWKIDPDDEHPMSENSGPPFREQLKADPSLASQPDELGWTLLHHQALAGSAATVQAILDAGAKPSPRTKDGKTPLSLARSLGWERIVALLTRAGAKG